jgi:hypothetical protein
MIEVSEVQSQKTQDLISVTDSGMEILSSEVQPQKALFPITVTPSGIVTLTSDVQPLKAQSPISVIPSGMRATPSLISYFAIILFVISLLFFSSHK